MTIRTSLLTSSLAILAALGSLSTSSAPSSRSDDGAAVRAQTQLHQMDWLGGSWSGDMWGGRFSAYYTTSEGGKIISHSKLMRAEEVAFYEFEVFELREEHVYLQPFPGGQMATGFQLKSHDSKARKAVFENPDKDYPTRIVYERVGEEQLVITLSDPHGGSDKVERFDLKRDVMGKK